VKGSSLRAGQGPHQGKRREVRVRFLPRTQDGFFLRPAREPPAFRPVRPGCARARSVQYTGGLPNQPVLGAPERGDSRGPRRDRRRAGPAEPTSIRFRPTNSNWWHAHAFGLRPADAEKRRAVGRRALRPAENSVLHAEAGRAPPRERGISISSASAWCGPAGYLSRVCSGLVSLEDFEAHVISRDRLNRRLQFFRTVPAPAPRTIPFTRTAPESRYLKVLWARVV